eukprot:2631653-Rhodomonas_salina.2
MQTGTSANTETSATRTSAEFDLYWGTRTRVPRVRGLRPLQPILLALVPGCDSTEGARVAAYPRSGLGLVPDAAITPKTTMGE